MNLRNARDVWGEGSRQYEACRGVAEGYVRARWGGGGGGGGGFRGGSGKGSGSESLLEEMVGRMGRMGLGGGGAGG